MAKTRKVTGATVTLYVKVEDKPLIHKVKLKLAGEGSSLSKLFMAAVVKRAEL